MDAVKDREEMLASDLSIGDWFYIVWGKYKDLSPHQVSEKDGLNIKTADGYELLFAPSSVVGVAEPPEQ